MPDPSPHIDFALPVDLPEVAALCESCIRVVAPGYFLARLRDDPTILPEGILFVREGPRIVATVTAHALSMRYGTAEIPTLGIANVVTDPACRGRGYSRALLLAAHQLARARHIPLALLSTGIPDFYEPLGYQPWERQHTEWLGWQPGTSQPHAGLVRPLDLDSDAVAIAALHDQYDRGKAGPLVRSRAVWERQRRWTTLYPREDPALGFCASDTPAGPIRSYVRGRADPGTGWADILEYGAALDASHGVVALAGTFARAAAARGAKGVRIPAACTELIEAFSSFAVATTTAPDATLLLSVLNPTGLLAAILPELTGRAGLQHIRLGRVALDVDGTILRLGVVEGTVALDRPTKLPADLPIAKLSTAEWIEVLMGVRLFSAQPFANASTVGEPEINLLDALFPRRTSVFWEADAF